MNNEVDVIHDTEKWLELYTGPYDLIELYNSNQARNFGLSVRKYKRKYKGNAVNYSLLMTDRDKFFIEYIATGVPISAFTSGLAYLGMSFTGNVESVWGGVVLTAVAISVTFITPFLTDRLRNLRMMWAMKIASKSKSQKKKAQYVNRALEYFISYKPKELEMFQNDLLLAYALWIHEKGRELRGLGKSSGYRKHLKNSRIEHFVEEKNYKSYLALAKDMNSGIFERKAIPRVAYRDVDIALFMKYSEIIKGRKDHNSTKYMTEGEYSQEEKARSQSIIEAPPYRSAPKIVASKNKAFDIIVPPAIGGKSDIKTEEVIVDSVRKDFEADMSLLHSIEREWITTQSDIVQLLKYPMISDMEEPLVQKFHTSLSYAKSLSAKSLDNSFVLAVSALKTDWMLLLQKSRKIELSKFNVGERKRIILASKLMGIALNTASTPPERQSAYKKAMEQLKGLVEVPPETLESIEQAVMRDAITA